MVFVLCVLKNICRVKVKVRRNTDIILIMTWLMKHYLLFSLFTLIGILSRQNIRQIVRGKTSERKMFLFEKVGRKASSWYLGKSSQKEKQSMPKYISDSLFILLSPILTLMQAVRQDLCTKWIDFYLPTLQKYTLCFGSLSSFFLSFFLFLFFFFAPTLYIRFFAINITILS